MVRQTHQTRTQSCKIYDILIPFHHLADYLLLEQQGLLPDTDAYITFRMYEPYVFLIDFYTTPRR